MFSNQFFGEHIPSLFEVVSPKEIAEEYDALMLDAYKDDLKDETALTEVSRSKYKDWLNKDLWIYDEKVPEGILDHPAFEKYRVGDILQLPFVHGESIMISQAVYSCQELYRETGVEVTPITDEPIHQYFLERRFKRGLELYNSALYREEKMSEMELELRVINEIVERMAVEVVLPNLKDVDISKLIAFREDNRDYLVNFRNGIAELTSKIRLSLGDREFEREIAQIIESDIKPMYDKLKNDSRITLKEFMYKIVKSNYAKIASVTTPGALVFGAFQTLPLWLGLLTSAGVFFGFSYAKEVLEKDKELKQNYLTYLLKTEKMSGDL